MLTAFEPQSELSMAAGYFMSHDCFGLFGVSLATGPVQGSRVSGPILPRYLKTDACLDLWDGLSFSRSGRRWRLRWRRLLAPRKF